MNRYELDNAIEKVQGYYIPRPSEKPQAAFERARQEAVRRLTETIANINALDFQQFAAKQFINPATVDWPQFKHDCDECHFLGQYVIAGSCDPDNARFDLYFCEKSLPTVIARYGDNGPDYSSGIGSKLPQLQEAERRAREAGLL